LTSKQEREGRERGWKEEKEAILDRPAIFEKTHSGRHGVRKSGNRSLLCKIKSEYNY